MKVDKGLENTRKVPLKSRPKRRITIDFTTVVIS